MKKNVSNETLLASFLVGTAIGATAAILFAPESGKVTRSRIRKEAVNIIDEINTTGEIAISSTEQSIKKGGDNLGYSIGSLIAKVFVIARDFAEGISDKAYELKGNDNSTEASERVFLLPKKSDA